MGSNPIFIPNKDNKSKQEIEHIGEGSFADVYLNNDTNVIIKRINIEKVINQKKNISKNILKEYIQSEIDIIKNLSHDNIISFIHFDVNDDVYNIYLENCEYGDMYNLLKNEKMFYEFRNSYGGFAGDFLKNFICQVSDGLIYLHEHNIIHRDIKPNNILVTSECNFKICDFGFSCVDITSNDDLLMETSELTILEKKYFNKSGTPYYIAPEIYSEMYYNTSSDCWSFGITIYEVYFKSIPLPKMNKIYEISKYLEEKESQLFIHDRIISRLAPKILKIILIGLLTISIEDRISLYKVKELLSQNEIEEIELDFEIDSDNTDDSKKSSETWEQLEDVYSMINITTDETKNLSGSFLKWLKNNHDSC